MNGVREEYSIKVKQTSKGIWYCDGLQVISERDSMLATDLNLLINDVEKVLKEHNFMDEMHDGTHRGIEPPTDIKRKKVKPVDAGGGK